MGVFNNLFKKERKLPSILNEEDSTELKELERQAYLEEAKKLVKTRGIERAKKDLSVKKAEWELN